jgi:hypothetical protein
MAQKEILIYKFNDDNGTVKLCNGTGFQSMKRKDFLSILDNHAEFTFIPLAEDREMKEYYKEITKIADGLKTASKGVINLYNTGTYVKTALHFFEQTTKHIQCDPIDEEESEFIENCRHGSIVFAEEHKGLTYQYDFKSFYPYIMSDNHILFPIKKGEFKTLSQKEFSELKFYQCGIYRCKIEVPNNKLFRRNKNNYYTQIDLNRAKELGYKMKLIVDGKPNFLYYDRKKMILGYHLFKDYVQLLFKMKEDKVAGAKEILNILWGALGQIETIKLHVGEDEELDIGNNRRIQSITPMGKGRLMVKIVKNDRIYRTNYARILPFLLAKGRMEMSRMVEPHIEFVKRVYTDSMFTTKLLPVKIGNKLGDLCYKGKCEDCEIFNCVKYTGKFK